MIVVGGWGSFWGPIVGTAVLTALPELLRAVEAYRNLSLGLIMALIVVFAPEGLGPLTAKGVKKVLRLIRPGQAEESQPGRQRT